MVDPQDFATMLKKQLDHLETKARLTQAEKLLRTCDTVIKTQQLRINSLRELADAREVYALVLDNRLARIPAWAQRIFNAH